LAFLVVAEALTRLILESPDLKGIDIGTVNQRITQFADDTTIFARDYDDARHLWPILDLYDAATGMRANVGKFLGIQMGSLKKTQPIANIGPGGSNIQISKPDKYGILLGVPFWKSGSEDPFLEEPTSQNKIRMATWNTKSFLTVHGRVQLANLICFGIPRYWVQSMCSPPWFNKSLKKDVITLLWDRKIDFDPEEEGKNLNHGSKSLRSTFLGGSTRRAKAEA
jgi:hypothetical protein